MKRNRNLYLVATVVVLVILAGLSLAKSGILGRKTALESPRETENAQTAKTEMNSTAEAQKIQRLQSIIPSAPALADKQAVDVMREAAQTRRDDALALLIRGLAFNLDPNNQNELMTPAMLLPAIQLIKENYGEKAAIVLYREALNSGEKWYRNRIALAIRTIFPAAQIQKMNTEYLQGATTEDFAAALKSEGVELYLVRQNDPNVEKLDQLIKARQEKKNK